MSSNGESRNGDGDWTFFTNHFHVLLFIARQPGSRLRTVAEEVGITERAAHRILGQLRSGRLHHRHQDRPTQHLPPDAGNDPPTPRQHPGPPRTTHRDHQRTRTRPPPRPRTASALNPSIRRASLSRKGGLSRIRNRIQNPRIGWPRIRIRLRQRRIGCRDRGGFGSGSGSGSEGSLVSRPHSPLVPGARSPETPPNESPPEPAVSRSLPFRIRGFVRSRDTSSASPSVGGRGRRVSGASPAAAEKSARPSRRPVRQRVARRASLARPRERSWFGARGMR